MAARAPALKSDDPDRPTSCPVASAFHDHAVIRPADGPPVVGITDIAGAAERLGIADPAAHVPADEDLGRPAEVAWRLVVGEAE